MDMPLFTTRGGTVPKRSKFWKVLQASRSILRASKLINWPCLLLAVGDKLLGYYVIKID